MNRIAELVRQHPLTAFFLFTLPVSWILWYFAGRYSPTTTASGVLGFRFLVVQLGEYSPALIGLLVLSRVDPTASARKWHTVAMIFLPVFALAAVTSLSAEDVVLQSTWLVVSAVGIAALVVYVLSPANRKLRTAFTPESWGHRSALWLVGSVLLFPLLIVVTKILTYHPEARGAFVLPQGGTWKEIAGHALAVFFMTLFYGGPLGEELGWRGFALPYLQKRYSPLVASVVLGFFWAMWHAPLDIAHGFVMPGFQGVACRAAFSMPLTVLFTFFYNRSGGSILVAILLHTSANSGFDILPLQTASSFAVFVLIGLILACCGVLVGRMWRKLPTSSHEVSAEQAERPE